MDAVATALGEPETPPSDMAEAISALHLLEDADLWHVARQSLSPERAVENEELHRQATGRGAFSVGDSGARRADEGVDARRVGPCPVCGLAEAAWA